MAEYLYLVRCNDLVKIGITNDVEYRLRTMQTGNPYPLELILQFEYKSAMLVERVLHSKFSKFRVRGEWFRFTDDELETVVKTCLAFEDGSASFGEGFAMEVLRSAVSYCLQAGINVEWNREGDILYMTVEGVNYDPEKESLVITE
jgi:hypothetical protein